MEGVIGLALGGGGGLESRALGLEAVKEGWGRYVWLAQPAQYASTDFVNNILLSPPPGRICCLSYSRVLPLSPTVSIYAINRHQ